MPGAAFLLVGGPDGQFLSASALLGGDIGAALSLLAIMFAWRLLSLPPGL